jgi:tetratricopeptide (TPR) repeat protein
MLRTAWVLTLVVAIHPSGAYRSGADAARVDGLNQRGCALRDRAQYAEAEALLLKALALAEEGCRGCELRVCSVENELGVLYKYTGRFDEAERAYKRALQLAERPAGSRDPVTLATLYHNLGGLEHARERYAAGEVFARRGLALREQTFGPNYPDVASDLAALAPLLDAQGKRQEAASMMIRALGIQERTYGPNACELAPDLNNLAALRYAEGQRTEALILYTRTLEIKQRCLGPDHPDVATTLNNMAVLFKSQGDRRKAAQLYQQSLTIFEKSLGPEHPKTIACKANYARLTSR